MRLVAKIIVALVCFFFANAASAVTVKATAPARDDALTTGAAARAKADVQIRRIRGLLVSSKASTDTDAAYQQMVQLQQQLRGEN